MTFDICVPAYNEAEIIEESLKRIQAALSASGEQEGSEKLHLRIIVADNASSDGTKEIVEKLSHPHTSVIRIETKGKGAAITETARRSTSEHFGFIDADLSAEPADILPLLKLVIEDEADIVIGSRLLDTRLVNRGAFRSATSYIFNGFRHVLLGIKVVDSQCGLKVMNAKARNVLTTCVETGWFLDMEFLAKAERAGLRIREVPVHWNEESFSGRQSRLRIVRDGFGAVNAMIRIRGNLNKS